jgi:hypothetical protein
MAEWKIMTPTTEAKLCDACKLVTAKEDCPLCGRGTREHPASEETEGYCLYCSEPFQAVDLVVITWEHDPYFQMDDGDMATACRECFEREDE